MKKKIEIDPEDIKEYKPSRKLLIIFGVTIAIWIYYFATKPTIALWQYILFNCILIYGLLRIDKKNENKK